MPDEHWDCFTCWIHFSCVCFSTWKDLGRVHLSIRGTGTGSFAEFGLLENLKSRPNFQHLFKLTVSMWTTYWTAWPPTGVHIRIVPLCCLCVVWHSFWCASASWRVRKRHYSSCLKSWILVSRRETSTNWWQTSCENATRGSKRSTGNSLWVVLEPWHFVNGQQHKWKMIIVILLYAACIPIHKLLFSSCIWCVSEMF